MGDNSGDKSLVELAKEQFGVLSTVEVTLYEAVEKGGNLKFVHRDAKKNDPSKAADWEDGRIIKADRIAWLCKNREARERVTDVGIRIWGARIDGMLDLQFANIEFPLFFEGCAFPNGIVLLNAKVRTLALINTHCGPISANSLAVDGDVYLAKGSVVNGPVSLNGATIEGGLELIGCRIANENGKSFDASDISVRDHVGMMGGFEARGEVSLISARIGGDLKCEGSLFYNPGGKALCADGLKVEGGFFLMNGFDAKGEVSLKGVRVGQVLDCCNGSFTNEKGDALNIIYANVGGDVLLSNRFNARGTVRLMGSIVRGDVVCESGNFVNANDLALDVTRAEIKGSVLLRRGFGAEGQVCLDGARIGQNLDCSYGTFMNKGGYALNAINMVVNGDVALCDDFKAEGKVRLLSATVGGNLECQGGSFRDVGSVDDSRALACDNIRVKGGVSLGSKGKKFKAEGMVRFVGAKVQGDFVCVNSTFLNKDNNKTGMALVLDRANIGGSICLRDGFKAEGGVRLVGAVIGTDIDCHDGTFLNSNGDALILDHSNARRVLLCKDPEDIKSSFTAEGKVSLQHANIADLFAWLGVMSPENLELDLRFAKIGTLNDEKESWPREGKLFLEGLVYDRIDPIDMESRLEWLNRQSDEEFRTQPYEQLADMYKQIGCEDDEKTVLIEKNKEKARRTGFTLWGKVFGPMIDYGYRPLKVFYAGPFGLPFLGSIISWIVLGFIFFGVGHKAGVLLPSQEWGYIKGEEQTSTEIKDKYPVFKWFMYSVDMFVPVVDFHQAKYWLPRADKTGSIKLHLKFLPFDTVPISGFVILVYMWVHILAGWVLTSLFVLGLTGVVKS